MTTKSSHARLTPLLFDIESRLGNPVDLASMAQKFGASPFHFHRLFRESVGTTPRQHIERLRLERAAFRLALTNERILDVSHAVGFGSHETFARAFKRYFQETPSQLRRRTHDMRILHSQTGNPQVSDQYKLSSVRLESFRPGYLLAKRRVGDYSSFDYVPFAKTDRLWNPLVRWAARNKVTHGKTAWGLTYDAPGLTPPAAQRFDGCIRINRAVSGSRDIQCLPFEGGRYLAVELSGPAWTINAAYNSLAYAMNLKPDRFVYREGPSLTIYRSVHTGGNPLLNHTTVCFPIAPLQQRKKRQNRTRTTR